MAAQDIGVAYVHVEPSGKGFGKSIEGDIGDAVSKASRKGSNTLISKIGGAFGKIGKVGTGAIATIAGGITALAAKGGFTRALNIENAQAKLKGLGHDSASVTEIMNDALASVKGTAFGLGDAATVAASLSASGIKEDDQLTKVLKTVADTAQISGRSLTDIGTIFGSVAARGKLQGDDMLQLMSSGIPVLQMLGKHLNKTSAEVSDMVSDGKIDFQTFADAMQEGLGGAAQSAGTTFAGALANVKAALSRLGETAATPVLNGLRGLFNQAIPLIDSFTAAVKPTLEKVGAGLQKGLEQAIPTAQAKLASFSTFVRNLPGIQMLMASVTSLRAQLSGLAAAMVSLTSKLNLGGEASSRFGGIVSALDLLRRLADADMAAGTPGTLVADGEWETRAWIAKSEPQSITPTMVETQLTIVLADGVWRRGTTEHHDPRADKAGGDLDYPYDYPHDYAGMSILDTVANATGMPQPVKLTIFGPCVNPYIIIGTNRYEVDATIPAGSRLEIDAASDSRTVTMISDTGLRTNLFGKAVRGTGRGSGTYIFEPLPPGTSTISWAGGFKFDLTAIEERSEPPWT